MPTIYDILKCRIKLFQFYGILTEKRPKKQQKCRCLFFLHGTFKKIIFLLETLIVLWYAFALSVQHYLQRNHRAGQPLNDYYLSLKILAASFLISVAAYFYLLKKSSDERYMILLKSIDTVDQPMSTKEKIKVFFKYLFLLIGTVMLGFSWVFVLIMMAFDGRYHTYDAYVLVPQNGNFGYLFNRLIRMSSCWVPLLTLHALIVTANMAGIFCNFFKRVIDQINFKLDIIRNELDSGESDDHEFAKKVENAQKEYDLLEQLAVETNKMFSPIVFAVFAVSFLFISEVENNFNTRNESGRILLGIVTTSSYFFGLIQAIKCMVAACVCNRKREKFVSQLQTSRFCEEINLPEDLVTCRLNQLCWTINNKITGRDWMTMGGRITFSLNLLWVITQRLAICAAFQTKWIAYWIDRVDVYNNYRYYDYY